MKLSHFITDHMETILVEWESFARSLGPAATGMSPLALRDHARQILEAIALDIETDQSPEEQDEKSKGMAPAGAVTKSAASLHGTGREVRGFTLLQVAAEYRALRASVLRLWLRQVTEVTTATSNDILRFNEAIDQALAESATTFSTQAARTRDIFLAILGHDLRGPLATMSNAGAVLTMPDRGKPAMGKVVGVRVKRSAATMTAMVNDLLEYARLELGGRMPITRRHCDMKDICEAALEDARAVHPDCPFHLDAPGDLTGAFDHERLQQVFTNLFNNAAQYRGKEHAVTILAQGDLEAITVQVTNFGPLIPSESLQAIFNPMVQVSADEQKADRPSHSLGLGLFIAREITEAHGGSIAAASSEKSGTVLTVRLPRQPAEG